jgi:molybdate transport system substrate-binding protein
MNGAAPEAYQFALFILSPDGQRTLAKYGFTTPGLPQ